MAPIKTYITSLEKKQTQPNHHFPFLDPLDHIDPSHAEPLPTVLGSLVMANPWSKHPTSPLLRVYIYDIECGAELYTTCFPYIFFVPFWSKLKMCSFFDGHVREDVYSQECLNGKTKISPNKKISVESGQHCQGSFFKTSPTAVPSGFSLCFSTPDLMSVWRLPMASETSPCPTKREMIPIINSKATIGKRISWVPGRVSGNTPKHYDLVNWSPTCGWKISGW